MNIECFGYMPLLALGGDEDTDNLKKFQIPEHIALINSYFLILM
ncbi:T6SS immunity protein Tdi1 domain-containing protein [Ruminococcus sp.]